MSICGAYRFASVLAWRSRSLGVLARPAEAICAHLSGPAFRLPPASAASFGFCY